VRVNIEIMRAFVRLRRAAVVSNKVMALVEDLSKRVDAHDAVIADILSIRQLIDGPGRTAHARSGSRPTSKAQISSRCAMAITICDSLDAQQVVARFHRGVRHCRIGLAC
jgi:hypothetical protein